MKHLLTIMICLISLIHSKAQTDQVRSTRCISGCTAANGNDPLNSTYSYAGVQEFESVDVVSDYSMRNCECPKWHMGVDYSSLAHGVGDDDRGDGLLAIQPGTIQRVTGAQSYKYLTIESNESYGYGHLFRSAIPGNVPDGYLKSGKFILKEAEGVGAFYGIINLDLCIAFSDMDGLVVDMPNLLACTLTSIETDNEVFANEEIGPLGDSSTGEVHLHLYRFRGSAGSHTSGPISISNTCDPLETVNHVVQPFSVNLAMNGNNQLSYPGTSSQSMVITPTLQNSSLMGDRINNGVMNIDKIDFQIASTIDPTFKEIKGPYYNSGLKLGARLGTEHYPSNIVIRYGNSTTTGQEPWAYTSGNNLPLTTTHQLYDKFYYVDFVTRIHKDDPGDPDSNGSRITDREYADVPVNARYQDGCYELRGKVTDVLSNSSQTLNNINLTIDNFMPYIMDAQINGDAGIFYNLTRKGHENDKTSADNGFLKNEEDEFLEEDAGDWFYILIKMSEPMAAMNIDYEGFPVPMDDIGDGIWWGADYYSEDECPKVRFTGMDKSNNTLINIYGLTGQNNNTSQLAIPTRKSTGAGAGAWNNFPSKRGEDFIEFCTSPCSMKSIATKGKMDECEELLFMTPYVDDGGCLGLPGYIEIDLPPNTYNVKWFDQDGNQLNEFDGELNIYGLSAGTYCYAIDYMDCCFVEECITIEQDPFVNPLVKVFQEGSSNEYKDLSFDWNDLSGEALPIQVQLYDGYLNFISEIQIPNSLPDRFFDLEIGGVYCLVITNADICSELDCFTVEGQTCDQLGVNPISLINSCQDEPESGAISIEVIEATNPCMDYTVEWDNGETSKTISKLSAGTYCVRIEGTHPECSCLTVKCFTIEEVEDCTDPCEVPPIEIEAETIPIRVCSDWKNQIWRILSGRINFSVTGGSGNYIINACRYDPFTGEPIPVPVTNGTVIVGPWEYGTYCIKITDECGNSVERCFEFWQVYLGEVPPCNTIKYAFYGEEQEYMRKELERQLIKDKWNPKLVYTTENGYWSLNRYFEDEDQLTYELQSSTTKFKHMYLRVNRNDNSDVFDQKDLEPRTSQTFKGEKELEINAMPNPFQDAMEIQIYSALDEDGLVQIFDVHGKLLREASTKLSVGEQKVRFSNLSDLRAGAYILSVKTATNSGKIKIIKSE